MNKVINVMLCLLKAHQKNWKRIGEIFIIIIILKFIFILNG